MKKLFAVILTLGLLFSFAAAETGTIDYLALVNKQHQLQHLKFNQLNQHKALQEQKIIKKLIKD